MKRNLFSYKIIKFKRNYSTKFNSFEYLNSWLGTDIKKNKNKIENNLEISRNNLQTENILNLNINWNLTIKEISKNIPRNKEIKTLFISLKTINFNISNEFLLNLIIEFKVSVFYLFVFVCCFIDVFY